MGDAHEAAVAVASTGVNLTERTARRAVDRVAGDTDLVLIVRPDDLDKWKPVAALRGFVARLVGSPIVRDPGGACVMHASDLWRLDAARIA